MTVFSFRLREPAPAVKSLPPRLLQAKLALDCDLTVAQANLILPRSPWGFLDNGSALVFISRLPAKAAEGIAAFRRCEDVSEQVILGRASDGQNLETGPRRWRIGGHNGGDGFVCGGSFAADEQPLPG